MQSGKYLEKTIETETGFSPNCWRCVNVRILIGETVTVYLGIDGYKDAASCVAGKTPTGSKTIIIENAQNLPEYQTVFGVFLAKILEDPAFEGAVLKDLPTP